MKYTDKKILVLDDEDLMRDSVRSCLNCFFGLEADDIDTGYNGLEGIKLWKENRYRLVISDIDMPEMNGLDFFKWLRSRNQTMPFLFLTGSLEYMNLVSKLFFSKCLLKPFEMKELLYWVENLTALQHSAFVCN